MSMVTSSPWRSQWSWPLVLRGHVDVIIAGLLGGEAPPVYVVATFLLLLLLPLWPFLLQLLPFVLSAPVLEPDFHLRTHTHTSRMSEEGNTLCLEVWHLFYFTEPHYKLHIISLLNIVVLIVVKMLNIVSMYWLLSLLVYMFLLFPSRCLCSH